MTELAFFNRVLARRCVDSWPDDAVGVEEVLL
jgi:hypothetical protein